MPRIRRAVLAGLLLLLIAGCESREVNRFVAEPEAGQKVAQVAERGLPTEPDALANRAAEVVAALAERDLGRLSAYAHPHKGVRFSPYAYVDLKTDRVVLAQELRTAWRDPTEHSWGFDDASGEPLRMTFRHYFDRFVYDADFAQAEQVAYDQVLGRGTTANNLSEVYPGSRFVEFHFSGFDPRFEGMDWKSLRLVFEQEGGLWYLVGIVHDQWTT